jgi:P27 family predicted phage terminase small subunit
MPSPALLYGVWPEVLLRGYSSCLDFTEGNPMAKGFEKPPLTIVRPGATIIEPPRTLGPLGRSLWDGVLNEFDIRDRAGLELLAQACSCADRAQSLAEQIDADGAVIRTRSGIVRSHPAIRDETQCRATCVRILEKLGVTRENLQSTVGRPPNSWGR